MSIQVPPPPPRARRSMRIGDRRQFRWNSSGISFRSRSGRI